METTADQTGQASWPASYAFVAILGVGFSAAALIGLHVASPEFAPSWRMVSEYANGQSAWLLAVVFFAWSLSSFALAAALWGLGETARGKIGLGFLLLAGAGQAMGGLFDINHPLHGPAAIIGIPALCIAAVVLRSAMARRADIVAPPLWSAHLPWIAFVLMFVAFALFFSALKGAGVDMSGQAEPLKELPAGVSAYVGYANRLLFAAAYAWAVLTALAVVRAAR